MAKDSMDAGKQVRVRCADGKIRSNVVWRAEDGLVYLCSDRQYAALRAGRWAPPPIGFPIEDVEARA